MRVANNIRAEARSVASAVRAGEDPAREGQIRTPWKSRSRCLAVPFDFKLRFSSHSAGPAGPFTASGRSESESNVP